MIKRRVKALLIFMKILIKNITIVTQDSARRAIPRGYLLIDGDSIACVNSKTPSRIGRGVKVIDGVGLIVVPGLINAHVHLGESIYKFVFPFWRGSLNSYLKEINAISRRMPVIENKRKLVCDYTISELIMTGTSTIAGGRTTEAAERWGLRNISGYMVMNSPKLKKYLVNPQLQFEREYKKMRSSCLSRPAVFIQSLNMVPKFNDLYVIAEIIKNNPGAYLMIHIAETVEERPIIKKRWGIDPLVALHKAGLLGSQTILIHGSWFTSQELSFIKKTGVSLVHCFSSNMNIGDNTLNIRQVIKKRIPFSIATDGLVTAGSIDLLKEAGLSMNYHNQTGVSPINAQHFFDAITISAARVLGVESIVGSIEVGKKADLTFLDFSGTKINTKNPANDIIQRATSSNVVGLMVNGKWKFWNKKIVKPATNLKKLAREFDKLGSSVKK